MEGIGSNVMDYVITANLPFEEIEAHTIAALEERGFFVQRSFSLLSAMKDAPELGRPGTGYSVLMLYLAQAKNQSVGLVTLHQQDRKTVIRPVVTHPIAEAPSAAAGPADIKEHFGTLSEHGSAHRSASAFASVPALVAEGLGSCVDILGRDTCMERSAPETDNVEDTD